MSTQRKKVFLIGEYTLKRIQHKLLMGKNSTADLYQATGHHFLNFLGNKDIPISEITPIMVKDFQDYLEMKCLKINTINSYLSSLRAIYNAALSEKPFKVKFHPFLHLKLKRDVTVKSPLSAEMIEKIATTDFSDSPKLELAADLSLFSFMAYGMPFVDMIHLKKSNIHDNEIIYNRHKTGIQIRIEITTGMFHIIEKYRNNSSYIFPIMHSESTYGQYKSMLASYNDSLKIIGHELSIHNNLTSYVLRHTWAAEAQRRHIPIAIISQALGHTSEKTTRCYLNQLDQSELNNANQNITNAINSLLIRNFGKTEINHTYL